MMNFLSHLREERPTMAASYESTVTRSSEIFKGVVFTISRISFGRRMDLARGVLELSKKAQYREAGGGVDDAIEANILACEIDRLYLRWGLAGIRGLTIDGTEATAELLAEKGPENLAREIVRAIKAECGLSEDERKN